MKPLAIIGALLDQEALPGRLGGAEKGLGDLSDAPLIVGETCISLGIY